MSFSEIIPRLSVWISIEGTGNPEIYTHSITGGVRVCEGYSLMFPFDDALFQVLKTGSNATFPGVSCCFLGSGLVVSFH